MLNVWSRLPFLGILLFCAVPAAFANDCADRLSHLAQGMAFVVETAIRENVISSARVQKFVDSPKMYNLFDEVDSSLLKSRYQDWFAQLNVTAHEGAALKDALRVMLDRVRQGEKLAAQAEVATRGVVAPRVLHTLTGFETTHWAGVAGYLGGRPILIRYMLSQAGFVEVIFDPFNPDPARQIVAMDAPARLNAVAPKILNLPAGDFLAGEFVYDLNLAKKIPDHSALDLDLAQLRWGDSDLKSIAGVRYGVKVTPERGMYGFNVDTAEKFPPDESALRATFPPLIFADGKEILVAYHERGPAYSLRISDLRKGGKYLRGFTMPSDKMREIRVMYIDDTPWLYFTALAGDEKLELFNSHTGERREVKLSGKATNVEVTQFLGRDHLVWGEGSQLCVWDPDLDKPEMREMNFTVGSVHPFEYRDRSLIFVTDAEKVHIVSLSGGRP